MSTLRRGVAVSVFLTVCAVVCMVAQFNAPGLEREPDNDIGRYLCCAQWWAEGLTPYVDFFDHKGPLTYLFQLVGLSLGGLPGLWWWLLAWTLLSAALCYRICRLYAAPLPATLASAVFLVMLCIHSGSHNSVETIAMPFVGAGSLLLLRPLRCRHQPSYAAVFLASISAAFVALMLKANVCLPIIVLLVVAALVAVRRRLWRNLLVYAALAAAALALVAIVVYLWLSHIGAWPGYLDACWAFNFEYTSAPHLPTWGRQLVFMLLVYPLAAWLAVVWLLGASGGADRRADVLLLLTVVVATLALTMPLGPYPCPHNAQPMLFALSALVAFALHVRPPKRAPLLAMALLGGVLLAAMQAWRYNKLRVGNDRMLHELTEFAQSNCPTDKPLFLLGTFETVYFFANRRPASKYFYQMPILNIRHTAQAQMIEQVRNDLPAVLIVHDEHRFRLPNDIYAHYRFVRRFGCRSAYLLNS